MFIHSAENPSTPNPRAIWLWLAAILLVGGFLRVHDLGGDCFDCDELYAVRLTGLSPRTLGEVMARDAFHTNHPPLMTVPYVFWTAAFGTSEVAVRLLPCLASLLTLVVVYRLGTRLGGSVVGLAAAGLLAINPLHISYAQEARQYAVVTLLVALCHLFFLRALQDGRRRDHLAYLVLVVLAAMSHYFAVLALLPHGLVLVWLTWRGDGALRSAALRLLLTLMLGAIPCLPWLVVIRYQSTKQWPHLIDADWGNILGCLRDVAAVRTPLDAGLLGGLVVLVLVVAGCWAARTRSLPVAEAAPSPPAPRFLGWPILALGTAGALAGALVLPAMFFRSAAESLAAHGYDQSAIERELSMMRQLMVALPLGSAAAGLLLLAWPWIVRRAVGKAALPVHPPTFPIAPWLSLLLVAPIAAIWLVGLAGVPFLQTRNLIVLTPALSLIVGFAIAELRGKRVGRWASVSAVLLLVTLGVQYRPVARIFGQEGFAVGIDTYDWRSLAAFLNRPQTERLPLWMAKTAVTDPALHYLVDFNPKRTIGEPLAATLPRHFWLIHIESNVPSRTHLEAIRTRGNVLTEEYREQNLVLYKVTMLDPA